MIQILDNSVNHYDSYKKLLSEFGDMSNYSYAEHQNFTHRSQHWYGKEVFLFKHKDNIVGTCSVIYDYKPFHSAFAVHIEDVVIDKSCRGSGLGKEMILEVIERVKEREGCYKIILDCDYEKNGSFYESVGFKKHEIEMRLDLETKEESNYVATTG